MDTLWAILGLVVAAVIMGGIVVTLVRGLSSYRRDMRIVDMRNRDCSASEIAKALNMTDEDTRRAMKRIAKSFGPTPPTAT